MEDRDLMFETHEYTSLKVQIILVSVKIKIYISLKY